jgi:hypothetical protein
LKHDPARPELERIEAAEWHHRALVGALLVELGANPRRPRELLMGAIGRFFGSLCFVGGRFAPMYAAGRLEAMNVGEYRSAFDAATALGLEHAAVQLNEMMAEEHRHEVFFADQVRGHWLLPFARMVGRWSPPPLLP